MLENFILHGRHLSAAFEGHGSGRAVDTAGWRGDDLVTCTYSYGFAILLSLLLFTDWGLLSLETLVVV